MLATMVVTGYNHEKYIREAIEGAFSQTYSPLEIIISDDCSKDDTFEIMSQMVKNYRGPHKLILNRNEENLGIAEHYNLSARIMKGEIRVGAAGDDISLPERVAKIVNYFSEQSNVTCVTSGAEYFGDKSGIFIPWALNRRLHLIEICCQGLGQKGATSAYHRSVFEKFLPLRADAKAEDYALTFRAALLGIRLAKPEILVKYRNHADSLTNNSSSKIDAYKKQLSLSSMQQAEHDLKHYLESEGISSLLAARLLRLHTYAYERLAGAAQAGKGSDTLSQFIFIMLSASKAFRLAHPLNWLRSRELAKQITCLKKQSVKL